MIKKTKFSTITAALATIAAIAALGSIGGGMGLGQQQTALAQILHSTDIGEDEIDVGRIEDTVRDILEDDEDDDGNIGDGPGPRPTICVDPEPVPLISRVIAGREIFLGCQGLGDLNLPNVGP